MKPTVGKNLKPEFKRRFVPANADLGDPIELEALFDSLEAETPSTAKELEAWLERWGELAAVAGQEGEVRNILYAVRQNDEKRRRDAEEFMEKAFPVLSVRSNALEKKFIANPAAKKLPKKRYGLLIKKIKTSFDIFREENVGLSVKLDKLMKEYQRASGEMTVRFDGEEQTLPRMNRYLEYPDAAIRKSAWKKISERLALERKRFDGLYDDMLELRAKIASNAGFDSFRDYIFPAMSRFDYGPDDCLSFHDAVEKYATPLYRKIQQARLDKIGADTLHPWDLSHDPSGRAPLKPFDDSTDLVDGCLKIFERLDRELAARFKFMIDHELLDLESRKHKAPGAWSNDLTEWRVSFILQNAVGRDDDVRTLLHESGHAFHTFECRAEPLVFYRAIPLEFAEVASMGMEFLGSEHLEVFYGDDDMTRSVMTHLEQVIGLFTWIATVDAFQHWTHLNPGHSTEQRADKWVSLRKRFGGIDDWSGYEEFRRRQWHRQQHIFVAPFYYIEYGIAQIGALQLWIAARKKPKSALRAYRKALALGGSRSLPELFKAAGLKFGMGARTLRPILREVESYLKKHSA